MNFEAWTVDLNSSSAVHSTGFKVVIEGDLQNPSGVHPGKFPEGLSALEQVRLLRCGVEAIVKTAQKSSSQSKQNAYKEQNPFAEHGNVIPLQKPERPVLSLKK